MQKHKTPEIVIEPISKHAEVRLHGEVIASSWNALALREGTSEPVVYFPRGDVETRLLAASHHETICPHKGTASHFAISVPGASRQNAAWCYLTPHEPVAAIRDHIAFYPDKLDFITQI